MDDAHPPAQSAPTPPVPLGGFDAHGDAMGLPAPPTSDPASRRSAGRRSGGARTAVLAAVVSAVVAAGVAVPAARLAVPAMSPAVVAAPAVAQPVAVGTDDTATFEGTTSIADVAAAVSPSVAYVEVSGPTGTGSGSAVIIDPDGHLLTNAHVVTGAAQITVTLPDGASYDEALVGADATSDVAVLHVDATGLPALAADAEVEIGETVVAIGSPFGLEGSVTSGIVSGSDRTLSGGQGQAALLGMIQTDAAINPGNSGGALVDADGELVGINTAIYSTSGGSAGVGFAIPATTALDVAEQLIATGTVTYAQLGISGGDVTPALADAYGLAVTEGALVAAVMPGSAAATAGIRPGDVVTAFDGEPVTAMAELTALVRSRTPAEAAVVTVDRDGEELELPVTLGAAS